MGRTAGSTRRTSATRCSTSACSSRPWRPRPSGRTLDRLYAGVKAALEASLGEPAMVLCHISHVYETGCSLYFTVAAKEGDDPLAPVARRQGRRQRRDRRGRRHDHPPPRGRHRPQAVAGRARSAPVGVSVLRAVKADLDPTGDPQPGGADPVSATTPASRFTFLVNPASGGGAAPEAVVPVARLLREAGATVDVTYSPGPQRDAPAWSTRRSAAATSWSRVGGDGMLVLAGRGSSSGGGGTLGGAARRPRQRLRPDARPARRTPTARRGCCSRASRTPGRPARRCTLPGAAPSGWSPARSTPASTPAPREIVDRAHWLPRRAAVPLRRASARSRPTSPAATGSRSTASSGSTPPRRSWSPTRRTTARA